jgi:hypothetical protein
VSPTIYVVASDPASALEEPKIVNAPPLFAGEPIAQPGSTENKSCSMTAAKEANIKTAKVVSITGELRGAISKSLSDSITTSRRICASDHTIRAQAKPGTQD